MPNIPVIDLAKFGLLVEDAGSVSRETFQSVGKQIYDVFSTSGFAYLTNHGIEKKTADDVISATDLFFALPEEDKKKFYSHTFDCAFDPIYTTKADMKHDDYYEAFRATGAALYHDEASFPDVPGFRKSCLDMAERCKILVFRILKALGLGMELKDPEYFVKAHFLMNRKANITTLKVVHYPPVLSGSCLSENGARLGEHTDWTTIVLLFQDDIGGLQIKDKDGEFKDITPIPGTIVMNIGDTLQKWSGNRLKATVHRVLPPSDPERRKKSRKSIVYFSIADANAVMAPLQFQNSENTSDVSEEKEFLTVGQYMDKRFDEVYH